jgi:para-aminobenzoate synthetase component 1
MRNWIHFDCADKKELLSQLILLTGEFEQAVILTDHLEGQQGYYRDLKSFDLLAGFGAVNQFAGAFSGLKKALAQDDWYLGFLSYDLKDELHPLASHSGSAQIEFPKLWFYQPRWLIKEADGKFQLGYDPGLDSEATARQLLQKIQNLNPQHLKPSRQAIDLKPVITESAYIQTVDSIQNHIHRGDIYEMNYCMEFTADKVTIDPGQTFLEILKHAPMPFSAFLKMGTKYVLSASPERFLTKRGTQLVSMPMKGTAPRGADHEQDRNNLHQLTHSVKERAENIMITDLVRNDLSIVAQKGSVEVLELCGIYPFPQVFQAVSTVSATMAKEAEWTSAIAATFPMGSMTGAPKHRAMQLIDHFEKRQRGLFSGAIGYISPGKDFDFNVVIRTLLYDEATKRLSYSAGSAITALSDPRQEYGECLLKAAMVRKILAGKA